MREMGKQIINLHFVDTMVRKTQGRLVNQPEVSKKAFPEVSLIWIWTNFPGRCKRKGPVPWRQATQGDRAVQHDEPRVQLRGWRGRKGQIREGLRPEGWFYWSTLDSSQGRHWGRWTGVRWDGVGKTGTLGVIQGKKDEGRNTLKEEALILDTLRSGNRRH